MVALRWPVTLVGRVCAAGLVLAVVVTACGVSKDPPAATMDEQVPASESLSTSDEEGESHVELAPGEASFVARFLVPVDGYRYVDDPDAAYDNAIALGDRMEAESGAEMFGAVSLRSVVADDESQNTAQAWNGEWETGYLVLTQIVPPVPYGIDEQLVTGMYGAPPIDRLDMSGVSVFVFEDPDSPHSRFTYVWVDHGVLGFVDGADREPLERWLDAYLEIPKLAESETGELSDRLIAVSGFEYSNVDLSTMTEFVDPLGDVGFSMHKVADTDGSIGILTLTDASDAQLVGRWLVDMFGVDPVEEIAIGQGEVRHYVGTVEGRQSHAFAWSEPGVSGALTTNPLGLDSAERFLAAFLRPNSLPVDLDIADPP